MRKILRSSWVLCAAAGVAGCATTSRETQWAEVRPQTPPSVESLLRESAAPPTMPKSLQLVQAETPERNSDAARSEETHIDFVASAQSVRGDADATGEYAADGAGANDVSTSAEGRLEHEVVSLVAHESSAEPVDLTSTPVPTGTLTIDGRTFRVELVEESADSEIESASLIQPLSEEIFSLATAELEPTLVPPAVGDEGPTGVSPMEAIPANAVQLDLASALAIVGGDHPVVGLAQWRVQEAYARLDQAEVLWLPSIRAGMSFHRHDGNYQASNGQIVDANRNSFQFGLGAGGTGAGTTQQPGIVAQFHLADALFQPDIARKNAWAAGHGSNAVYNEQLLDTAVAYLELLEAEQDKRILDESRSRTAQLAKLTRDFAEAGEGLQADADRMATELTLIDSRLAEARERIDINSARLAQALSIRADQMIVPMDPVVVPIQLVSLHSEKGGLIQSGLANRPELKEAQALVAAACDEYKRQKYAPFVPSVLLGLSTGGFGGGLNDSLNSVDERYDLDALMLWEVRNLGFGEKAVRRQTSARYQQAKFDKLRVLDQVAREVAEAYSQVTHRMQRVAISEQAIQTARDSFERNLSRIRDGEGLPIEVLQSIRALEDAQRTYLRAVADHNEAQFRLQWAMGWPVSAPAG